MRNFLAMFFVMMILLTGCSNEPPVEVKTARVAAGDGALTLILTGYAERHGIEQTKLENILG